MDLQPFSFFSKSNSGFNAFWSWKSDQNNIQEATEVLSVSETDWVMCLDLDVTELLCSLLSV